MFSRSKDRRGIDNGRVLVPLSKKSCRRAGFGYSFHNTHYGCNRALVLPRGPVSSSWAAVSGPLENGFLLGSDLGRDVASGIVHGAKTSLLIGLIATLVSIFIGIFFGAFAGYFGGRIDDLLMRITEIFKQFHPLFSLFCWSRS